MPFIRYGCPSMEELESYSQEYKKKLDEVGALGEIPDDLALEVTEQIANCAFLLLLSSYMLWWQNIYNK